MCNVSFSENTYLKYSFFVPSGEKILSILSSVLVKLASLLS